MSIEPGLKTFLLADTGIAAAIGDRLYPVMLPQGAAMPSVVYTLVSDARVTATTGDLGLAAQRIQIDCYGATYKQAADLSELIRARLHAYRGSTSVAPGNQFIQGAFMQSGRSFFESEPKQWRHSRDYIVWFND